MSVTHHRSKAVLAAGTVLWRPVSAKQREVAVIHRPRYDDWSLPKGKLDRGETLARTAIRETAEETGFAAHLGPFLDRVRYTVGDGNGRLKEVSYWSAHVVGGEFTPNSEVDRLVWLPPTEARKIVTYPFDRKVLRRFDAQPISTTTVIVVRHAKAGQRKRYRGDDRLRPLDKVGRAQADAFVDLALAFGADRVHAADRTRCISTVAPLAQVLAIPVQVEPMLSEEAYASSPSKGRHRLVDIALEATADGTVPVVCSQGKVIPDLIEWLCDRHAVTMKAKRNRKASSWVLSFNGGRLIAADHIDSPLPIA